MKNKLPSSFAAAILLLAAALAAEPKRDALYRWAVKNLAPPPTVLGEEWVEATGLVIEDFADRSPEQKAFDSVRPTSQRK